MRHTLLHIYGPFAIHSFGFMIALGVIVFTWLIMRHPLRAKIISYETAIDALMIGIIVAASGGRLLYVLSECETVSCWTSLLNLWEGGFSILGSVLGIIAIMPWYFRKHAVPIVPLFDLMALHAPLLQSISRLGCFFAGCCYGTATSLPWGITYTDYESIAPLGISLHPTQLYSALFLFFIFLFLYYVYQSTSNRPGQMSCMYLMLISLERFSVDFYRGDHALSSIKALQFFSINQWIALGMFITAFCGLIALSRPHATTLKVS